MPAPVVEKAIVAPRTLLLKASVTLAVALLVEAPSATMADGDSCTAIRAAGPATCVSVAVSDTSGLGVVSVAVIVDVPDLVVLVIVAVYVPCRCSSYSIPAG